MIWGFKHPALSLNILMENCSEVRNSGCLDVKPAMEFCSGVRPFVPVLGSAGAWLFQAGALPQPRIRDISIWMSRWKAAARGRARLTSRSGNWPLLN